MSRSQFIIAAAAWLAILIVLSLVPAVVKRRVHTLNTNPNPAHASWNHRAPHFLSFALTAALLYHLARVNPVKRASALLIALGATITLAVVLEFAQHRFYRTKFETWDVRDDAIAALVGAFAAAMLSGTGAPRASEVRQP